MGSYPIAVTLGANPNYTVTTTDSALTVIRRGGDGHGGCQEQDLRRRQPALTAVVTGTVDGDALNYTLATTARRLSGVGSYPITVTLGTNPNYA